MFCCCCTSLRNSRHFLNAYGTGVVFSLLLYSYHIANTTSGRHRCFCRPCMLAVKRNSKVSLPLYRTPPTPLEHNTIAAVGKSASKPALHQASRRSANGMQGTDAGEWPEESAEIKTGIPAVMKYAILAMICALAFFIRLFAVVSVCGALPLSSPRFVFAACVIFM